MNLFKFWQNCKAVAAIEFALIVPMLLFLFLGGFDLTRYVQLYQKLSKTSGAMSDLITRSDSLHEIDFSNSFAAVEHLLAPYYDASKVKVVISSVMNDGTGNRIMWQRCGGGALAAQSQLGQENELVALPAGFSLDLNEDTIVAEVYYKFDALFDVGLLSEHTIGKFRYAKPRLGALTTIVDDAGLTGC